MTAKNRLFKGKHIWRNNHRLKSSDTDLCLSNDIFLTILPFIEDADE